MESSLRESATNFIILYVRGASNCLRVCGGCLCVSAILLAGAVSIKIYLNRMARELERDVGKYTGEGNTEGVSPWGFFL